MSVPGLLHELTLDPGLRQACPLHLVHKDAAECQHLMHLLAVINWCHSHAGAGKTTLLSILAGERKQHGRRTLTGC
jgi:hypothetical protein